MREAETRFPALTYHVSHITSSRITLLADALLDAW